MKYAVTVLLLLTTALAAQQTGVRATVHNLSASGPGDLRSITETEVCKFCHIPHHAVAPQPLWGHKLADAQYDMPDGRTRSAPFPQPDGSSRLCLSCHDGTVALGDIGGRQPIPVSGGGRVTRGRPGFLGTDLSGSHPISFVVDDRPVERTGDITVKPLDAIRADRQVRLDRSGKMQCTSCHDPHADPYYIPGRVPHFLVKPNTTELCLTCHALQ